MDTSEQYIKMCDCPEIQDYHYKANDYSDGFVEGEYYADFNDMRGINTQEESYWEANIFCEEYPRPWGTCKHIWLPTQSQLQEMVDVPDWFEWSDEDWLNDGVNPSVQKRLALHLKCLHIMYIENFYPNCYMRKFTSMEQLWLAFVRKEKFGKVWSNGEWVKN